MPKKILIIDDEADMQTYLRVLFEKAGYQTEIAANGNEALEILGRSKPDLITLDILMPRKSGLNFYEALRTAENTKDIPVIVVSGISGNREFFESEPAGSPTVFVDKPIEPDRFLAQAKKLLGD